MKLVKQLLLAIFFAAGAFFSCTEDKGNYDYDWIPNIGITFEKDSIAVKRLKELQVEPIFVDKNTDTPIEINHDDYEYVWEYMPESAHYFSDMIHVSNKYNIDESILLPVSSGYGTMRVRATNKKDNRIFIADFKLQVTDTYKRTYLLLTEDPSGTVDLEFYGWDENDDVLYNNIPGYLSSTGFPFTAGGAKAIEYHAKEKKIYIASGSGMGWLTSPGFDFSEKSTLEYILFPKTTDTFEQIVRLGGTGVSISSTNFYCFTPTGELNVLNGATFIPTKNYLTETMEQIKLAPMLGAYYNQRCALLWDDTNNKLLWANFEFTGMGANSNKLLNSLSPNVSEKFESVLYMGGSADASRALTAIVKDVKNTYWRLDYEAKRNSFFEPYYPNPVRTPKVLVGTKDLGEVDHWYISSQKGYLYAAVGKTLHTYVESQTTTVADPGWTQPTIKDADNNPVTIEDPISFIWAENNGSGVLQTCFYVVTYSAEKGGTVYMLNPGEVGSELKLIDKFSGLGNVKKMCYWWG
ncbi:PKD-like family lipoprotein [Bacteroides sp. 224]|uniref:PKD-like family lipoprotein n=1 Tax=Bacteroides sp. 224 TaxID=2302936 RepID=UPI0013D61BA0|nr:PKD-like family lipoprotein [Bacteroides sp. 224]NDV64984.1 hypothetical protein [Bacteroides sp. 224]